MFSKLATLAQLCAFFPRLPGKWPRAAQRRRRPMGGQCGFTLLEMLVALSVFSLAVLALVKLVSENFRTTEIVEARIFAAVVAENRAVEAMTATIPPALGGSDGTEEAAGFTWRWTRRVSETAEAGVLRVDVDVRPEGSDQVLGQVTIFRARR